MKSLINYGEIHYGDVPNRPNQIGIIIPGPRGKLLATLYTSGGKGPHPLILLFHGIPGNEQNLDIAQALRREGFHVLTFHYSGSWGSDGEYSLKNNLEDAETVLDFILKDKYYGIDRSRIYAIGHSLGGFVCGQLSAKRKEIAACAMLMPCDIGSFFRIKEEDTEAGGSLYEILEESALWLRGAKAELFLEEIKHNYSIFPLEAVAWQLAKKPVLCVEALLDIHTPPKHHCHPLEKGILAAGGTQLRVHALQTDHCASDYRLELIRIVTDYFWEVTSEKELTLSQKEIV